MGTILIFIVVLIGSDTNRIRSDQSTVTILKWRIIEIAAAIDTFANAEFGSKPGFMVAGNDSKITTALFDSLQFLNELRDFHRGIIIC